MPVFNGSAPYPGVNPETVYPRAKPADVTQWNRQRVDYVTGSGVPVGPVTEEVLARVERGNGVDTIRPRALWEAGTSFADAMRAAQEFSNHAVGINGYGGTPNRPRTFAVLEHPKNGAYYVAHAGMLEGLEGPRGVDLMFTDIERLTYTARVTPEHPDLRAIVEGTHVFDFTTDRSPRTIGPVVVERSTHPLEKMDLPRGSFGRRLLDIFRANAG